MNPKRALRLAAELLVYVAVALITCLFVEIVAHRHEIGNGAVSANLAKILPVAFGAAVGIWLAMSASRVTMTRRKSKGPKA